MEKVEESVEQVAQPTPPALEKLHWEEVGYLGDLARVCDNLESLPTGHFLPENLETIVQKVTSSKSVEDYNDLSETDLNDMLTKIRVELPNYQQSVMTMFNDMGRVQSIVISDDFI